MSTEAECATLDLRVERLEEVSSDLKSDIKDLTEFKNVIRRDIALAVIGSNVLVGLFDHLTDAQLTTILAILSKIFLA